MTNNTHSSIDSSPAGVATPRPFPRAMETVLPFAVLLVLAVGWFVAVQYKNTLEQAVISSCQETQMEIVRAVARSANYVVQDMLQKGSKIEDIEQVVFKQLVEPVRLLRNGDAWIYAPDHVVFDLSSDFPDEYRGKSMAQIFATQEKKDASHYEAMTDDVTNAREGVG